MHLEALESLNSSSEQKVRRFVEMLSKDASESIKTELLQMRQLFDDVHNDESDDGRYQLSLSQTKTRTKID